MSSSKKLLATIALVGAAQLSFPNDYIRAAAPAEPSVDQLRQQIGQLQRRLDDIEKQQQQQQKALQEAEVRHTVDQLAKDAEARSHLLGGDDDDLHVGYDNGLYIRSSDGNFSMHPGVNFQFRGVANSRTDPDDSENGFEIRRLRPYVSGNAFSPNFTYFFQGDTNRNGGSLTLLDAWAQYSFSDNWALKVGQFKESWDHEKDVSIFAQLAVDRTLIDALIGGNVTDRVQGVSLTYGGNDKTSIRVEGALTDGANSKNTNFEDPPTNDWDFGVAGRVEYKLFGNWSDYKKEFTARSTKQDMLVVGAGFDFSEGGDTNQALYVVDAEYKTASRWTLYGALHGRTLDNDTDNSFTWGAVAQVGYAINQKWEPYFRYDVISFQDPGADRNVFNEITVGINYYLGENGSYGQRAKFSVDFVYLPDGAPSDQSGYGILQSNEAEYAVRAQFQLLL